MLLSLLNGYNEMNTTYHMTSTIELELNICILSIDTIIVIKTILKRFF